MSRLRARCPDCRTLTAVAIGSEYECHACGRGFRAGLVRVPRAWGRGGEAMAEAARLPLAYPEAAVVEEGSLGDQSLAVASDLPERPVVLGGCCCAHVGAVEGLVARHGRIAVVWLDAHGDLNTPASSPSGDEWGMALRMLIDSGAVAADDVALVGARALDPAERDFIAASGLHSGAPTVERTVGGSGAVYIALDCDVLDSDDVVAFMPEPGGLPLGEVEDMLAELAARTRVVGMGVTGLRADPGNVPAVERLLTAAGL